MKSSEPAFDEFILLGHFFSFLKYWWIAVLTTLLGGLIGFLFSHRLTPIYEAVGRITVNVDLSKVTKFPVERQDEELALYNVQVALLDTGTINNVLMAASQQNIILDKTTLLKNHAIERKLAFWELRYRDENPLTAQKIVNLWLDEAVKTFQILQASGKVPSYVILQGVMPADTPQTPIYYLPTWLILAGAVIGLVCGILIAETIGKRLRISP